MDYCVTVLDDTGTLAPDIHYWEAWPPPDMPEHKRPKLRRTQEWGAGATINVGSRQSAYYLRVYNKHEESPKDYPLGSWRWEVEMKREASEIQQHIYRKLTQPGRHVLAVIEKELNRVSLTYPWRPGAQIDRVRQIRPRPDADRTLGWLAYQVRPSAQFAAQARGRDAVLAALEI